ncbi:S1/P1 nuclease [Pedobacter sandarakinus]|uniref:S1/P1 nuclease n=1 Tax=Pedobacter sandarakinus TaxID=353156 RepID=UPI002246737F|nr:S1/P1 nuclease [Pedobacter sandarakinus]MCX2575115.1 S1/P1 nuclease [Pedobacter sandarakinus]
MKKYTVAFALFCFAILTSSWGFFGHKTVASIAEVHLSEPAKSAVSNLLGSESLVDVAAWADEVRNQPAYRNTAGWHFVNLPLGLNRAKFRDSIGKIKEANLLSALVLNESILLDPNATKSQKAIALKFVVHLVGDAHQPMHVSRAEDKGGNSIQVQFDGKGTNLHTLWDSRLLDHQGLSIADLVAKDNVSRSKIRRWQKATPEDFLFESYKISSKLYKEVAKNNNIDEAYYQSHIGIANQRTEMGGIRLAGILNELFKNGVVYK